MNLGQFLYQLSVTGREEILLLSLPGSTLLVQKQEMDLFVVIAVAM